MPSCEKDRNKNGARTESGLFFKVSHSISLCKFKVHNSKTFTDLFSYLFEGARCSTDRSQPTQQWPASQKGFRLVVSQNLGAAQRIPTQSMGIPGS